VTPSADAPASAAAPALEASGQAYFRPDIQGLRAVAVLVVLLFHGGGFLQGGFIGVDAFFVISGFVITLLLMREWAEYGRIRLVPFALRRFRRLSPPLALTVIATLLASVALASPIGQMQMTAATAVGAMLFAANLAVLKTSVGYFHPTTETNALLHTWSLSVEEQFYLVFPLLLVVYALIRRRRPRHLPIAPIAAVTAVSLGVTMLPYLGVQLPFHRSTETVFYSPVTRAWEFGVGALLALAGPAAHITRRWLSISGAVVAVAALAWSVVEFSDLTPHPGPATLVPVLATALLIAACADPASPQARLLALRPLRWTGDRSYAWYLWHWPVVVFVTTAFGPNRWLLLAAAVLSLGPAMASYRWIEQPMRSTGARRVGTTRNLVALCLGLPLLLAGGLWLAVRAGFGDETVRHYQADVLPLHQAALRGCDSGWTADVWLRKDCTWQPTAGATPDTPWVYLVGDSHADHLSEAMIAAADELGRPLRIATATACPLTGLVTSKGEAPIYVEGCLDYNRGIVDYLVGRPPGTVVISNSTAYWSADEYAAGTGLDPLTDVTAEKRALFRDSLERLVRTLTRAGHQVLVMQSVPSWTADPAWNPLRCTVGDITDGTCRAETTRARSEQQFPADRAITSDAVVAGGGQLIEPRDALCSDGICRTEADGVVLYRDDNHLSWRGSALLAPLFVAAISDPG